MSLLEEKMEMQQRRRQGHDEGRQDIDGSTAKELQGLLGAPRAKSKARDRLFSRAFAKYASADAFMSKFWHPEK